MKRTAQSLKQIESGLACVIPIVGTAVEHLADKPARAANIQAWNNADAKQNMRKEQALHKLAVLSADGA